jgi:hypothetical protein
VLPGEEVGGVDVAVAQDGLVVAPYQRNCCHSLESSTGLHERRQRDGVVPPAMETET